jgi:hypothetical protein
MSSKGDNRFWLHRALALIYFFFNTVALPPPVSYTSLIAVVKVKSVLKRYRVVLLVFLGILLAFAAIQIKASDVSYIQ